MVNKTDWIKGIGPGRVPEYYIRGRMTTIDKSDTKWRTLEDYATACQEYFGADHEIRCYEYKNHYAVVHRRIKN